MSSPAVGSGPGAGKKAVHVKWAGKTIALGTFPSAEADEKCQKAKALTRAWRSTMRPKPSREWVMLELERLGVRVVSGRLGRKAGEDGDDQPAAQEKPKMPVASDPVAAAGGMMGQAAAGMGERNGSLGWSSDADLHSLMARRNSSLGLSMMNDTLNRRGSLGSLGQLVGVDSDATMPPHRPFVGGGAAAAYEAARHDHFTQKSAEQQRRASSLGLGSLGGGVGLNMSVNPNQHYEMLKLHHMNLLNEIQETTLMMNLYQQQQLQQQQQQLQQQASAEQMGGGSSGSEAQLSMLMQQNGVGGQSMDGMFGGTMSQRNSLGLGATSQLGGFGSSGALSNITSGHPGAGLPEGMQAGLQQNLSNSMLQQAQGANGNMSQNRGGEDAQLPAGKSGENGSGGGSPGSNKRKDTGGGEGEGDDSPASKRPKTDSSPTDSADNGGNQK